MLRAIGFWRGPDSLYDLCLPHPKRFVDSKWECLRRENIISYLRSASIGDGYLGHSWCRFKCGITDHEMGSSELTDGVWCWPEGLAHYVEQHRIKLPDEFVAHAESNNWSPPSQEKSELNYDLTYWREWCRQNARPWWKRSR